MTEKKMIIIFVCRTYDFENDNNIHSLFEKQESLREGWQIIKVDKLEKNAVRKAVGTDYDQLSSKLKELLRIPSNLYIWQHLDKEGLCHECLTTSHLIDQWFEQICKKSAAAGLQPGGVKEAKTELTDALDRTGRLYVPKQILKMDEAALSYLMSSELIVVENQKVSFVHQSLLDYFISQRMMEKYFDGRTMEEIVGERSRQTPGRRYQVQMFLQNILECDSRDFVLAGEQMLNSDNIRYYVKYIFYEILGQIQEPDVPVVEFVIDNCEKEAFAEHLQNSVILGRRQYISALRDRGILERWYADSAKKAIVFRLLESISQNLDQEDILFIKKHAFCDTHDDEQFMRCFGTDITRESGEMFELRMMFYERYPEYAKEIYMDVPSMMKKFEERTIRLISLWLKNKMKSQGRAAYSYEEELVDSNTPFLVENGELVLDELLPYIPRERDRKLRYGDWSGIYERRSNIERLCVELVKKASTAVIRKASENFWNYYKECMGQGYPVFNEIILDGLSYLPPEYSNQVMRYLSSDLDKNIFDYTSGADSELELVKRVLKAHGSSCGDEELRMMENAICRYISPNASEWYRRRIEVNREKEYEPVYWSFWGDLQYELLRCLPEERMSKSSVALLRVLDRRFQNETLHYRNPKSHAGGVTSPVSGKNISSAQWLQIMTNSALMKRERPKLLEIKDGFIESSYEMYAADFCGVVTQKPQEMIELVLEHRAQVLPAFVDAMFLGVEMSEKLEEVDFEVIEKMIQAFPCDMESWRASYFCEIIEKMSRTDWSASVLDQLKSIALNHKNPEFGKPNVTNQEDEEMKSCDMLHSNALNCVRGNAARAIGHLLWQEQGYFSLFKPIVEALAQDENPAVRFASLYALWPSYNIDREWAEERIIRLYESDVRMAGFDGSKNMFFRLYPKYKGRVLKIIKLCFESADKRLVATGGHAVCEFYICHGEFEPIMQAVSCQSTEQVKAILDMAVVYLKIPDHRETAKRIILNYGNVNVDVEFPLSKIFYDQYVDAKRDREFLQELMRFKAGRRTVRAFVQFLEKNAVSVIDYADIILKLCENVLQMDARTLRNQWGIEDEISKLVISLYDEAAGSNRTQDRRIAEKCLDLWDVMFEKQLGAVRRISEALMER